MKKYDLRDGSIEDAYAYIKALYMMTPEDNRKEPKIKGFYSKVRFVLSTLSYEEQAEFTRCLGQAYQQILVEEQVAKRQTN